MSPTEILWQPWAKETFQKAQELDKIILLDISAVWCHWCHVMDQTTYSDSDVIALVTKNCVPMKVDRDQRPDIDKRYNMGGWPTTAFLTPNGKMITGGTYIPPEQMKSLIKRVITYYKKNKETVEAETEELEQKELLASVIPPVEEEDLRSAVDNVILAITESFDQTHGGFGSAPKFPNSEALDLALLEYRFQNQTALLNIVTKTLKAMQEGGIHDKVEGGFFRYSTMRDWSIPHYEKMSEDNAKLLVNYLHIFQVTGEESFKATAQKTLTYINANLRDHARGGFYASQDADEEYYRLNEVERKKHAKPRVDKTIYTNYNAMLIQAYLLASVVLENPEYESFAVKTVRVLLDKGFDPKEGMCHFILNDKPDLFMLLADQVYMIGALIDVFQWTQERSYLRSAELIARLTLSELWSDDEGFLDRPTEAESLGMLKTAYSPFSENAVAADMLLRLHRLTGDGTYLDKVAIVLKRLFKVHRDFSVMASSYALAIESYMHPVEVHIVGYLEDAATRQFVQQALSVYNPSKTVEVLDPTADTARLKELKYPAGEEATAYVCAERKCVAVEKPVGLVRLLGNMHSAS